MSRKATLPEAEEDKVSSSCKTNITSSPITLLWAAASCLDSNLVENVALDILATPAPLPLDTGRRRVSLRNADDHHAQENPIGQRDSIKDKICDFFYIPSILSQSQKYYLTIMA
jgi:hypothetical protein